MSTSRKKSSPVRGRVESKGVQKRLGRPVQDATEPLALPITPRDLKLAQKRRNGYDVDEPENFGECVLATCISKVSGAEVAIMRNHAYVALPDDPYTLRFEVSARSREFIRLNDLGRFDEIKPNSTMSLMPPGKARRLVVMRARFKTKGRGKTGTGPKRGTFDPYQGVVRNGIHAQAA